MAYVLEQSLKLLHPIMPHITEKIWQLMSVEKSEVALMKTDFPVYNKEFEFEYESEQMQNVFEAIKSLRNLRADFNIPVGSKINIKIDGDEDLFSKIIPYIKRLARVENVEFEKNSKDEKHCAYCSVGDTKIVVPLEGLIDINKEIERQNKKIQKFEAELNSLNARLNNEKFVNSAPKEVVEQTRARTKEIKTEISTISELISKLS